LQAVLNEGIQFLTEHGIEQATLLAERLLQGLLDCKRFELYLNSEQPLSSPQREIYFSFLKQRAKNIPSQYILGRADFMDFTFQVTPSVLIPRPETELLVEKVVQTVDSAGFETKELEILDVGTGSGNIAVSLALYLPKASVWAVDISDEALQVARLNAMRNEVGHRIRFLRSDLFQAIPSGKRYDLIVSNPPYLSERDMQTLAPEISHEPAAALFGGPRGTEFIERFITEAPGFLAESGGLFFEIGAAQAATVTDMLERWGWKDFEIFKDYSGWNRVVMARWKI